MMCEVKMVCRHRMLKRNLEWLTLVCLEDDIMGENKPSKRFCKNKNKNMNKNKNKSKNNSENNNNSNNNNKHRSESCGLTMLLKHLFTILFVSMS